MNRSLGKEISGNCGHYHEVPGVKVVERRVNEQSEYFASHPPDSGGLSDLQGIFGQCSLDKVQVSLAES